MSKLLLQLKAAYGRTRLFQLVTTDAGNTSLEVAGQILHLRCDLGESGWLDWTHARQLVRVQRVAEHPVTGKTSVGNRYYVTSRTLQGLTARSAPSFSRYHWRCENETHWTSDAELLEDRRRLARSRNPRGILVVAAVRMMASAILAVAPRLSRISYSRETRAGLPSLSIFSWLCAAPPCKWQRSTASNSARPGVGCCHTACSRPRASPGARGHPCAQTSPPLALSPGCHAARPARYFRGSALPAVVSHIVALGA